MSAPATQPIPILTVALGWREPNGQVIEFGDGASAPSVPAPASSGSSSFDSSSDHAAHGGSAPGSNVVDLLA